MTNDELHASGFPDTWDNTMRGQVAACPRKLYFFLRGFDYAYRPAYFSWGSAWEEILATWYSRPARTSSTSSPSYLEHANFSLEKGLALWDADAPLEKGLNKRSSFERIFQAYLETYPIEQWTLVEGGAEAGWSYPLEGTPFYLGGSMDGFIDWPGRGKLVLENKTDGGYLSEGYCESWSFSPQVTGYIWYASKILGSELYGCLMNLATKNLPGPRSAWTTPRFARTLIRKTPSQLAQFEEEASWHISLIKREHWDRWWWPVTLDKNNCAGGTMKAPCTFKSICLSNRPIEEVEVSQFSNLVERPERWEPWKRSGEQD